MVDMISIALNSLKAGAGDKTSLWARVLLSHGFVVGVKEDPVLRIKDSVILGIWLENEGFKEPTGMR